MNSDALRTECEKCGLHEGCDSPFMAGSGSDEPYILFVGEAPGAEEDRRGEPFVGPSGKLLRDALEVVGLEPDEYRFTNVLRCRPPDNKTPTVRQIGYCAGLLVEEIKTCAPNVVVPLGNVPLKAILGEYGITDWHGISAERDGITYVPAFHPAYILRNMSALDEWIKALDKAAGIAVGEDDNTSAGMQAEYNYPHTHADFQGMAHRILNAKTVAYDIETSWLQETKPCNAVLSASFGIVEGTKPVAWSFPIDHSDFGQFVLTDRDSLVDTIGGILTWPNIQIVGHNIRFDRKLTRRLLGIDFEPTYDTMLMNQLLDARRGVHSLKRLAGMHLGMYDYDQELRDYVLEHPECDPTKGGSYQYVPLEILLPYGGKDAVATILLLDIMLQELDDQQRGLFTDLIMPADGMLGHMESNGFMLDHRVIERYRHVYQCTADRYLQQIQSDRDVRRFVRDRRGRSNKKADREFGFNPNSSDQLAEVLFRRKRYRSVAKTKTGKPSVKADVLKDTPGLTKDKFYKPLRQWRLITSMINKYLRSAGEGEWEYGDNRVRSSFNIGGAKTGRLSSSDPNLQNIPTPEKEPGTLLAYMPIKNIFTHTWEGGCLCQLDYSGMELRVMASISGCQGMIQAFEDGLDIHTYVTGMVFKMPYDDVTKELRYRGKWCNWTFLFGGDEHTLHSLYGLSLREARDIKDGYFSRFGEILDYQEATVAFLRKHGYVTTPFGRRLYIPEIYDDRPGVANAAKRTAINMRIQSLASDVLLCAGTIIQGEIHLNRMRTLLVNTVHDSLVADVYPKELTAYVSMGVSVMENVARYQPTHFPHLDFSWLKVPLVADVEIGSHYGALSKYEVGHG